MRNNACVLADDYQDARQNYLSRAINEDEWLCNRSSQRETTLAFYLTTTKMLGKIISPEQSKTKANDFLNLWLKMWMNYRVVSADNLLEGRTGVANKKQRLRSSQRLPTDLSQSTQCYKTQSKLPSMIQAQLLSNLCEMRRENPISCQCWIRLFTTINSQTMIEQKCDDQIRMRGRRFCYARDNQ
jgi:hypothetical protein